MSAVRRIAKLVGRLVVMELKLYRALVWWVLRRRPGQSEGMEVVGYARLIAPMLGLWIFASAVETAVFHLITPWESVRLVLDVAGVWGLAWMLGLTASLVVYPHLVGADVLRLRCGVTADLPVPWARVATLQVREQDWPSSIRTIQWGDDDALAVAVGARTNVVAALVEPTTLAVKSEPRTVSSVAFWVDEPREFAREHRSAVRR